MNTCKRAADLLLNVAENGQPGRNDMVQKLRMLAAEFEAAGQAHATTGEMCPDCDDDAMRCVMHDMALTLLGESRRHMTTSFTDYP